eukprot:NODE_31363_length_398_cov_3.468635.p2 GENE.NODE_31363_length_398_cov_3.468635~~NODE_31363_length_398_cov_3.468635.p2  ORF type:complete len:81 (+),score=27.45 NODE_31363_length_398_cov_3.468635:130-372(+)
MQVGITLDEFFSKLVKDHLNLVDPQKTDDVEKTRSWRKTEVVFCIVLLALVCYSIADYVYPWIFKKKKKGKPKILGNKKR